MAKVDPKILSFRAGLNTTGLEDGTELPRWSRLENGRLSQGSLRRRAGSRLLATATYEGTALDLVAASSHHVAIPLASPTPAFGTKLLFEALVEPDATGVLRPILAWNLTEAAQPIYLRVTTDDTVKATLVDANDDAVSLESSSTYGAVTLAIAVVRSGATLTLYVNGVVEDAATMHATRSLKVPTAGMYLGRFSTTYMDGTLDYVRCRAIAPAYPSATKMRLHDPRVSDVLFDYVGEVREATTKRVEDRSRFGNHGAFVGTPSTTSILGPAIQPVTALGTWNDENRIHRLLVQAGRTIHLGTVLS